MEEWAEWVEDWNYIKHNFSRIPNKKLKEIAKEIYSYHYYRKMFKKFIYWFKQGKLKYLLTKLKIFLFQKQYQ